MCSTHQWRRDKECMEHELRMLWRERGLGYWIAPWKLAGNVVFKRLGNAGKTLWMELIKAEIHKCAILERVDDETAYFAGIKAVHFTDVALFDSTSAIPTMGGFSGGKYSKNNIRTLKTLERIWHEAGFEEHLDKTNHIHMNYNQEVRDHLLRHRKRSEERRLQTVYNFKHGYQKKYPRTWFTKPTPDGTLPPMDLPKNKNM